MNHPIGNMMCIGLFIFTAFPTVGQLREFKPYVSGDTKGLSLSVLTGSVYGFRTMGDQTFVSYLWMGPNYLTVINNKKGWVRHIPLVYRDEAGHETEVGSGSIEIHNGEIYVVARAGILVFNQDLKPVRLIAPPNSNFTGFIAWEGDWLIAKTNYGLFLLNERNGEKRFVGAKETEGVLEHPRTGIGLVIDYKKVGNYHLVLTAGDGIMNLDLLNGKLVQFPETAGVSVTSIVAVNGGRLLLSLEVAAPSKNMMYWFDPILGTFSRATEFAKLTDVLGMVYVPRIYTSVSSPLWFIVDRLGIGYWNPVSRNVTWTTYQDGFLKKDYIYGIYEDSDYIWVGYSELGAQRIDKKWFYDRLQNSRRPIEGVLDTYNRDYQQLLTNEVDQIKATKRSYIPRGHENEMPEYFRDLIPSVSR